VCIQAGNFLRVFCGQGLVPVVKEGSNHLTLLQALVSLCWECSSSSSAAGRGCRGQGILGVGEREGRSVSARGGRGASWTQSIQES
jgi:hypothetical protein